MSRSILITGANGSLGSCAVLHMARSFQGNHFILAVRNTADEKSKNLARDLTELSTPFTFMKLDLTSVQAVNSFVGDVIDGIKKGSFPKLSVIINCAAYQTFTYQVPTEDGFDPVLQTNYLSPFLLTTKCLSILEEDGRIINIGTAAHKLGNVSYFSNPKQQEIRTGKMGLKDALSCYGSSKLMLTMFGFELQRRLVAAGRHDISVITMDPGGMNADSRLASDTPWQLVASAINPVEVPAAALSTLACGLTNYRVKSGYFILDERANPSQKCMDVAAQATLWQNTESMEKLIVDNLHLEASAI